MRPLVIHVESSGKHAEERAKCWEKKKEQKGQSSGKCSVAESVIPLKALQLVEILHQSRKKQIRKKKQKKQRENNEDKQQQREDPTSWSQPAALPVTSSYIIPC